MKQNIKMSPIEIMESYLAKTNPETIAKLVQKYTNRPSNGPTFSQYLETFSEVFEEDYCQYFKVVGQLIPHNRGLYSDFIDLIPKEKITQKTRNKKDSSKKESFLFIYCSNY